MGNNQEDNKQNKVPKEPDKNKNKRREEREGPPRTLAQEWCGPPKHRPLPLSVFRSGSPLFSLGTFQVERFDSSPPLIDSSFPRFPFLVRGTGKVSRRPWPLGPPLTQPTKTPRQKREQA